MFVTFCVLKCDTSIEVKFPQPENMWLMSVTFCVLKCDKSRDSRNQ